ncbi:MAG TPA: tetratricopeptide repeat protein, partial [bacterium]|nr:tetratricopeptide repeat protein [bacterium]
MKVRKRRSHTAFHGLRTVLAVILAGGLGLYAASPSFAQADPAAAHAQADAFISQASSAMQAGDIGSAASLAESALQLAPSYSEALFLSARVEAEERAETAAALDHVQAAVRNASWGTTDPSAARQLLTTLLTRTGRTTEARREAERLVAARPDDPFNFLLLARALDKAGSLAAEMPALSDALSRFPESDELRMQAAGVLARLGRSAEAAALVRTGLKVHPDSLPLLLSSAGLEIDRALRRSEADQYLARGGTDPLAAVLGMEAAPVAQRKAYL